MALGQLADLLEANKDEIALEAAEAILEEKIPSYMALGREKLIEAVHVSIDAMVYHIRGGSIELYQQHVVDVATERRKQGSNPLEATAANLLVAEKIKEMIERELPGPRNEQTRAGYIRRLDVLLAFDRVTGITTILKTE